MAGLEPQTTHRRLRLVEPGEPVPIVKPRLKKLRRHGRMSQDELAAELSVPIETVEAWETGKQSIPAAYWQPLSELFEISYAYLLGDPLNVRFEGGA